MSRSTSESIDNMSQNDVALLNQKLDHLTELVKSGLDASNARIANLEARLNGLADEPEKGIVVRLDRVEQWKARATKIQWLLIGSAVTFFAERLLHVVM